MTHDPMCHETWSHPDFRGMHDFRGAYDGVCPMCNLIAKVRADERADALQDAWTEVASSALPHILAEGAHPDDCSGCDAVKRAVLALNRLRGES